MAKKQVQTIADIARMANVSKSTVSRALNDSPLIGMETKERIVAIAREHNFRINATARQLSLQQSNTIAFVTHAFHKEFSVADLFLLEIMGGISRGLYANGYDMLVVHVEPYDSQWIHHYLDSGRVDGFILTTCPHKQHHIQDLLAREAPFITWGAQLPNTMYCTVTGDNLNGGKLATQHLVRSGRRQIAFIGGPPHELEVQYRYAGYENALQSAGLQVDPALVTYGDYSNTSGAAAMQRLLEHSSAIDGVFVNSDLMAIAAIKKLRQMGRRVPDDVAVVGYDDLSIAAQNTPALTTIRQDIPQAGKLLAQNLIQYIQTGAVTNAILPVELVIRETA
ncbi:MAG: LacI family DNA-binding transcriptional regulator [Anaerolineaceae bacterium]|nr:LacI family DNA-binding transcriptional regulator [Anaerolineaceae bacterium]